MTAQKPDGKITVCSKHGKNGVPECPECLECLADLFASFGKKKVAIISDYDNLDTVRDDKINEEDVEKIV